MTQVNVLEAKSTLSKLIKMLESGVEDTIVIARNGKPVADLVIHKNVGQSSILGAAKGKILAQENWDNEEINQEIASMFQGA